MRRQRASAQGCASAQGWESIVPQAQGPSRLTSHLGLQPPWAVGFSEKVPAAGLQVVSPPSAPVPLHARHNCTCPTPPVMSSPSEPSSPSGASGPNGTSESERSTSAGRLRRILRQGTCRLRTGLARKLSWFGGGFYSLAAGITLIAYEIRQLRRSRWLSPDRWDTFWARLSGGWDPAIGALARLGSGLFSGAADGFVAAVAWPVYLLEMIEPVGLALTMALGSLLCWGARRAFPPVRAFFDAIEEGGRDRTAPPG